MVHLVGNLQLFKHDDGAAFNTYSHFMGTNPIIRTIEWGLVLGFGFHIYEALALTRRNKAARGAQGYVSNHSEQNSEWTSRNMGILGTIILIFLIVHLYNFFWRARLPATCLDGRRRPRNSDYDNLYLAVVSSFHIWWYVLLYVAAQISLGYHLWHGFRSGFQTLGLNHRKYTPAHQVRGLCICRGGIGGLCGHAALLFPVHQRRRANWLPTLRVAASVASVF